MSEEKKESFSFVDKRRNFDSYTPDDTGKADVTADQKGSGQDEAGMADKKGSGQDEAGMADKKGSDQDEAGMADQKGSGQDEAGMADQKGSETKGKESGEAVPPIDFSTFILSLYSTAIYHMGGYQDPVSGKTSLNLDIAKQNIDIMEILESKTRGNLTQEESRLMSHSLHDLRMKYVEVSSGGRITP